MVADSIMISLKIMTKQYFLWTVQYFKHKATIHCEEMWILKHLSVIVTSGTP